MRYIVLCLVFLCLVHIADIRAAEAPGPVAEWKFDEGQGSVLRDSSGSGNDATISGASWVKQGNGHALSFDGIDDFFQSSDKSPIKINGPITVEMWMKPIACGWDDPTVLSSTRGYELIYSSRGLSWWSVDGRRYDVGGRPQLGEWNHLVCTFNGSRKSVWINGRLTASQPCKEPKGKEGKFVIGSSSQPCYRGLIGGVRLFDRAISSTEIRTHFKAEAGKYGFESESFQQVQLTPFYYLDRGEIVLDIDYNGLRPLEGKAEVEVTLANQGDKAKPIDRQVVQLTEPIEDKVKGWSHDPGAVEATLRAAKLPPGTYVIGATLRDEKGARSSKEIVFDHPTKQTVASPQQQRAEPLPPQPAPTPFKLAMAKGGGFELIINEVRYPFASRISWPNGDFNRLSASDTPSKGEASWNVEILKESKENQYRVRAGGSFYTIDRHIEVLPTHVYVKDTYTNTTDTDLGLLIYNETPIREDQVMAGRLSGYKGGGRQVDSPGYRSSSVFVKDTKLGIGMVPMDDVYVIHSVLYAENGAAGMGTENFALAPGKSHTLEWSIYPTGSGDYWDFVNTFRKVEGRIATLESAPGWVTYGGSNRRQLVDEDFIKNRGTKIGIITNIADIADDRGISLEGFEFIDFPKERDLMRKQALAMKLRHPGIKLVFHNAHTLYATNDLNRFNDSKLMGPDKKHKRSGGPTAFSKERLAEGWAWGVYYPVPGNSFHDAMMKSVDVMMDEMAMDGCFVDGFLLGYGGPWTYDGRWDGHSADIDLKTKTITRKKGSVLLLMQPSMIEYARKIRDKGGVVISNGAMITRSVANEKYIIFDAEIQAGPECHLAPTVLSLGNGPFRSEKEMYFDMLDKLRWGVVYMPFNERIPMTRPSLGAKETPITFEEIRSGTIRGKERIITMNSGVYGWPGDRHLHLIHKFDARGTSTANTFVTTADTAGVRTTLEFAQNESAVIEPLPASVQTDAPVNLRVLNYDAGRLHAVLNGNASATIDLFVGTTYPDWRKGVFTNGGVNPLDVKAFEQYQVTIDGKTITLEEREGVLSIPLKLAGQVELKVEPAKTQSSQ